MENFTNETIDIEKLPKLETIVFSKLNVRYWTIILINLVITAIVITMVLFVFFFVSRKSLALFFTPIIIALPIVLLFLFITSRIGFLKKGYAFRTHDVVFKSGILSTNTMVIPYNRVQHIALHEGFLSQYFGLASIEIFTAGGDSSDIRIPGIEKQQAENIKQLLMGKIKNEA